MSPPVPPYRVGAVLAGSAVEGDLVSLDYAFAGAPDHQADVRGGGRHRAEQLARRREEVVSERRIRGHPGVHRMRLDTGAGLRNMKGAPLNAKRAVFHRENPDDG